MLLEVKNAPFRKALATSSTDAAYSSRVPQSAEPTGAGVIDLSGTQVAVPNAIMLCPYATCSSNDTYGMRLFGWRKAILEPSSLLWIPVLLLEVNLTAGLSSGVTGGLVGAAELFADTVNLSFGGGVEVDSPGNDTIAHTIVPCKGFNKLEAIFKITSGPTNMNALYATF